MAGYVPPNPETALAAKLKAEAAGGITLADACVLIAGMGAAGLQDRVENPANDADRALAAEWRRGEAECRKAMRAVILREAQKGDWRAAAAALGGDLTADPSNTPEAQARAVQAKLAALRAMREGEPEQEAG